jgi:DNA-binding XRE family transcriptional regulator
LLQRAFRFGYFAGIFRAEAPVPVMKERNTKAKVEVNNVRKIREGLLMSKAELARRAGLSVLTIDRVEKGMTCRMDTKRKIILSLGLQLSDRDKVFLRED